MRLSPFPAILGYLALLMGAKDDKSLSVVSLETQLIVAFAYLCRYWTHLISLDSLLS